MKPVYRMTFGRRWIAGVLIFGCGLALEGCPEAVIRLDVVRPAELDVSGIETIAVGGIQAAVSEDELIRGEGGRLQVQANPDRPASLVAAQVKAELISALSEVPHYRLIDTDAFADVYDREELALLAQRSTFNPDRISGVIMGEVWAGSSTLVAREGQVVTLEEHTYRDVPVQQPRQQPRQQKQDRRQPQQQQQQQQQGPPPREDVFVQSQDQVVETEKRELAASLAVRFTLIRLVPRVEVVATETVVVSYTDSEIQEVGHNEERPDPNGGGGEAMRQLFGGGEDERDVAIRSIRGISSADQAFAALAREAVGTFVRRIAPTTGEEDVRLAAGDSVGVSLIRAGAYDGAIRRLGACINGEVADVTYGSDAAKAPDFYNLGVAYEAQGPDSWEDAARYYRRALALDLENDLYAEGVGRVSRLLEAWNRVQYQRIIRNEEVSE